MYAHHLLVLFNDVKPYTKDTKHKQNVLDDMFLEPNLGHHQASQSKETTETRKQTATVPVLSHHVYCTLLSKSIV